MGSALPTMSSCRGCLCAAVAVHDDKDFVARHPRPQGVHDCTMRTYASSPPPDMPTLDYYPPPPPPVYYTPPSPPHTTVCRRRTEATT
uniref:Uncharacterized protein n=1 Tax=Oryza glumipatula TaxID=40148 RepID=A0A0E0BA24_9ORYZ